jgi:hypothetical protein
VVDRDTLKPRERAEMRIGAEEADLFWREPAVVLLAVYHSGPEYSLDLVRNLKNKLKF